MPSNISTIHSATLAASIAPSQTKTDPVITGTPASSSGATHTAHPAMAASAASTVLPPIPPHIGPTRYFRLESDKSPSDTSLYSIGNNHKTTDPPPSPPSPANDTGPEDPADHLPSTYSDLIPAAYLSQTSFTTAGTSLSSVPLGVKSTGGSPQQPRRFTPEETLERRRFERDCLADSIAASAADQDRWDAEQQDLLAEWVERMQKCGTDAYFMPHPLTGRKVITNFWGCRVRVCPICAWRASIRKACRYTPRIESFMEAHPTYRLRFVTLTDRPAPMSKLNAQSQRLHKGFAAFYKTLERAFVGYLRCTDIDTCWRDPDFAEFADDQWKEAPMFVGPHIHAILIQRPKNGKSYVTDGQIQQVWASAMDSKIALDTHVKDIDSAFGAVKYGAKGLSWAKAEGDYNYAAALALALDGVRCIASGGVLRGSKAA